MEADICKIPCEECTFKCHHLVKAHRKLQVKPVVDGYAVLITDKEGKLLDVEDLYCNDDGVRDCIEGGGTKEEFDYAYEHKDAKFVLFFAYVTEEVGTYEYRDYESSAQSIQEVVLVGDYQEHFKRQILKLAEYANYTAKTEAKVLNQDGDFLDMCGQYQEFYGECIILPETWSNAKPINVTDLWED